MLGLGLLVDLAVQIFLRFVLTGVPFIVVVDVVVVFRLFRLQYGTPADDDGLDEETQSDVVDDDDAEVQAGLDD